MADTALGRAEAVAQGLARRLRTLETERAAEAIDSDALFNQLERSHASLRSERDAISKKYSALAAEQATAGQAKEALAETIDQLKRERRTQDDALKRLTAAERAWVRRRRTRHLFVWPLAARLAAFRATNHPSHPSAPAQTEERARLNGVLESKSSHVASLEREVRMLQANLAIPEPHATRTHSQPARI